MSTTIYHFALSFCRVIVCIFFPFCFQARQLLNDNERGTLNYYLNEYQKGHVTADSLVLALCQLLNTPSKVISKLTIFLRDKKVVFGSHLEILTLETRALLRNG